MHGHRSPMLEDTSYQAQIDGIKTKFTWAKAELVKKKLHLSHITSQQGKSEFYCIVCIKANQCITAR